MFKKLSEKKNLLVKSRGNGYDTLVNTPPATLSITGSLNDPTPGPSGVRLVDTRVPDNDDEGEFLLECRHIFCLSSFFFFPVPYTYTYAEPSRVESF